MKISAGKPQDGHALSYKDDLGEHRYQLGDDGCQCGTEYAHVENGNKQCIQEDVEYAGDGQGDERCFGISKTPHGSGQQVIQEGQEKTKEHHPEVGVCLRQDNLGRPDPSQDGGGKCEAGEENDEGEDDAENQRGCEFALHLFMIICTVKAAHEDGCAHAEARNAENDDRHNGIGRTDGSQGIFAQTFPDDHGVNGIVG